MSSVVSPTATTTRTIRIGSRKSQLALVQTHWVQEQLQKAFPDITFEVQTMNTQGDKILDVALAKIGDKEKEFLRIEWIRGVGRTRRAAFDVDILCPRDRDPFRRSRKARSGCNAQADCKEQK